MDANILNHKKSISDTPYKKIIKNYNKKNVLTQIFNQLDICLYFYKIKSLFFQICIHLINCR